MSCLLCNCILTALFCLFCAEKRFVDRPFCMEAANCFSEWNVGVALYVSEFKSTDGSCLTARLSYFCKGLSVVLYVWVKVSVDTGVFLRTFLYAFIFMAVNSFASAMVIGDAAQCIVCHMLVCSSVDYYQTAPKF